MKTHGHGKTFMLEPPIYAALTSKAGLSQIELAPHEIGQPSDTDSSLQLAIQVSHSYSYPCYTKHGEQ